MAVSRFYVVLILILVSLTGCERTITSGEYGPLRIGQSKSQALAALRAHGISPIYPVVCTSHDIVKPSRGDLIKYFSNEAGISAWASDYPLPLNIEFIENKVSRKWTFDGQIHTSGVKRLDDLITLGMSREAVFDVLADLEPSFGLHVENFAVGKHELQVSRMPSMENPQLQKILLANDCWKFAGFEKELQYARKVSLVTLHFRFDRLERISHAHSPIVFP